MSAGFFKPVQDRDLLVNWSTFWDYPVAWGRVDEFTLTPDQTEWLNRNGSTWVDCPVRYADPTDGLIFRFPFKGREVGGYLPWINVPAVLELLLTPESEERTQSLKALMAEVDDEADISE